MQTYDFPQTAELVEIVRGTSLHIPTVLAVMCGLRRGEICALRWRNVDLIAQGHARQRSRRRKGGPARGAGDVSQGRGRV
jgi:integrase